MTWYWYLIIIIYLVVSFMFLVAWCKVDAYNTKKMFPVLGYHPSNFIKENILQALFWPITLLYFLLRELVDWFGKEK